MDRTTGYGLLIGIGGILIGMYFEGGHMEALLQGSAAVIVLCGTLGAVMVSTPVRDFKMGLRLLRWGYNEKSDDDGETIIANLVDASTVARREGVLALEARMARYHHPYLQSVLRMVIDGVDEKTIHEIFEGERLLEEERLYAGAKIWTDAGGFAPTIGIIGAVLGLIHVMQNLTDTSKLGAGIAVAFVATIYGVGTANLIFLPIGNKIKRRIQDHVLLKQVILEGALSIKHGLTPHLLYEKLAVYQKTKPFTLSETFVPPIKVSRHEPVASSTSAPKIMDSTLSESKPKISNAS